MDKLELLQHTVQSLSRKRPSFVLGHHAGVTQQLDMVDLRHLAHHLLSEEQLTVIEDGVGRMCFLVIAHALSRPVTSSMDRVERFRRVSIDKVI
jgi:hypothetical protein